MRAYVAAFAFAALASVLLTPAVRLFAVRFGAVAAPGGRHVHRYATPRLGGVAILLAFLFALGGLLATTSSVAGIVRHEAWRSIGLLAGAAVMSAVGFVDDVRGVRAMHKLLLHVAVAIFAFACGFRIDSISLPYVGTFAMGVFAFPITVAWIVGIVNAVNLIDGLDGLAAGVVLFAGITNFVIATIGDNVFVAATMATMSGAVLGFLFFNFNPARIFMGDSGSYFLGYTLAVSALVGRSSQKTSTAVALLVPCLALGVPIFDTLFTMVRRFLERRSIFSPDRGHLHHRLIDMGLTHRRAVLTLYGMSILFSVTAIAVKLDTVGWQAGVALLSASVALVGLVRFAGYFEYLKMHYRRRGRIRNPSTERLLRAMVDLPARLELVHEQEDLYPVLDETARQLGLQLLDLREKHGNGTVHEWHADDSTGAAAARDSTVATFSIGDDARARAKLTFAWPAEAGAPAADAEVLLQLLVAFVERALGRIRSPLAPEASSTASARRPAATLTTRPAQQSRATPGPFAP